MPVWLRSSTKSRTCEETYSPLTANAGGIESKTDRMFIQVTEGPVRTVMPEPLVSEPAASVERWRTAFISAGKDKKSLVTLMGDGQVAVQTEGIGDAQDKTIRAHVAGMRGV